jgi:hypothetical protein
MMATSFGKETQGAQIRPATSALTAAFPAISRDFMVEGAILISAEPTRSFGPLLDPDTQKQALSWADPQRRAGKRPTQTLIHDVEGSSKTRGVDHPGLEPFPRSQAASRTTSRR